MRADAVFEGGGVKGIAFVGAIQQLEEKGWTWERLAGTSAGAVIASLLAAGYTAKELQEIMYSMNYSDLLGKRWYHHIPFLGLAIPLLLNSGIYINDVLEEKLANWLRMKGIVTFSDLPEGKLKIIASDISSGRMLILPDDLEKYGLSANQFPIAAAVRMSTTLPYFYQPFTFRTKLEKKTHYVLDGGLLSNYPIWLFDDAETPRWPAIGFRLSENHNMNTVYPISGPFSMFSAMFKTMLKAHDQRHVESQSESRTIFIPTGHVTTTQFDLKDEDRDHLYQAGREAAAKFMNSWSLAQYMKSYKCAKNNPPLL